MTIEAISRGTPHYPFSSMYPVPNGVEMADGRVVPTVEHGYQASKFADPAAQEAILSAPDGYAAKTIARDLREAGVEVRPEWEQEKIDVMRGLVRSKFLRNPEVAKLLRATGDEEIYEGNGWKDRFWGVSPVGSRKGKNWLGRILMETREDLHHETEVEQREAS